MATTTTPDGIAISFTDHGGDGPAVLFSHGFLMNRSMFDEQVAAFGGAYRCITWDERGFGETRAEGPFSYWDSANDAIAVLDACGVDRAVFVGMSQGGFLSLRAALAHPDRVAGVVLIDSQAGVDDAEAIAGYEGMLHVLGQGSDEERAGVFQVVSGMILGDETVAAQWIPVWDALDREQLVLAGGALLGRDDVTGRLGEISCPVLGIHGTADQAIDISEGVATVAGVSDGRGVVPIEGAAHAPNMTHPAPVNAALASFLAEVA